MDDRKTIGANFKRHLKSKAMSQREAASLIGISAPHLANLLNGVENMGYIVAKKICAAFPEVSPEYLLTGEGVLCPPPGTVRITQAQRVTGNGTGIQSINGDQAMALENAQLREQLAQERAEKQRLLGIIDNLTKK